MPRYTQHISNTELLSIVRRTFNQVDHRLVDHGVRVASLVARVLPLLDHYSQELQRDICFLAALHDIGAYKTEEIDDLLQFETVSVWNHAVYGSLFLKHFSPFTDLSGAVLLHHLPCSLLDRVEEVCDRCKLLSQVIFAADRLDILMESGVTSRDELFAHLDRLSGSVLLPNVLELFRAALPELPLPHAGNGDSALAELLEAVPFTQEQADGLFKMLIFGIDFRSRHTVTHTVTTTVVAKELAVLLGFSTAEVEQVVCGALLHDLGKIGIPVEILEYPGKLSPQAMDIMRTHVVLTGDILAQSVDEPIRRIAVRHHEKLDGTGYPLGLTGAELTTAERAVAVADIISALCGTRSYKDAFPKDRVLSILDGMRDRGFVDPDIVQLAHDHFNDIMDQVRVESAPVLDKYLLVKEEYDELYRHFSSLVPV